jgi:hypothetical protein
MKKTGTLSKAVRCCKVSPDSYFAKTVPVKRQLKGNAYTFVFLYNNNFKTVCATYKLCATDK